MVGTVYTLVTLLKSTFAGLVFALVYNTLPSLSSNTTLNTAALLSILSVMFDISWFYYGMENIKRVTIRNIIIDI